MTIVEIVLLVFAVYRVTRFLVFDSLCGFSLESNSKLSRRIDVLCYDSEGADKSWLRGKFGDLLTCPVCLGFWVSLIGVCLVSKMLPWHLGVDGWLTVWAVAGAAIIIQMWGPTPNTKM